jgi:hypothetical protein
MGHDWTAAHRNRWRNAKIEALSPLGKTLFEFLTSNDATTVSGIYPLNIQTAIRETGIPSRLFSYVLDEILTVHKRLPGNRRPLVRFDGFAVWIVGQWKHASSRKGRIVFTVGNEFIKTSKLAYWPDFFKTYPAVPVFLLKQKKLFSGIEDFSILYNQVTTKKTTPEQDLRLDLRLDLPDLSDSEVLALALEVIPKLLTNGSPRPGYAEKQDLRKGLDLDLRLDLPPKQTKKEREGRGAPPLPSPLIANTSSGGPTEVNTVSQAAASTPSPEPPKNPAAPRRQEAAPPDPLDLPPEGLDDTGKEIKKEAGFVSRDKIRDELFDFKASTEMERSVLVRYSSRLLRAKIDKVITPEEFDGMMLVLRGVMKRKDDIEEAENA